MPGSVACAGTVTGRGPPVFMVHGIGARRATWDGLVDRVKDDFTCITYELRGHGASPHNEARFGLADPVADLVADLEALRSKLGIERASVIGHSLGGMIGAAYARAYPTRFSALGLLSTAAFRSTDDSSKAIGLVKAMEHSSVDALLDSLVDRWFTADYQASHPDNITTRRRQILATPRDVFLNVFRIYAATEMGSRWHEKATPSLVLTGELDGGCTPRLNKQIAQALKKSEPVILDGLKHAILIEAPEPVAPHVRRFLKMHAC